MPEFAYRKVYVTGEYDYEHELELGPKTREGELGYHVVTPLKRGQGQDTIMVNRGFVKREKRDREERPASLVSNLCRWGISLIADGIHNDAPSRRRAKWKLLAC